MGNTNRNSRRDSNGRFLSQRTANFSEQQPETETTSSPELEDAEEIVEEIDNELGTGNKTKRVFPVWLKVVFVVAGLFVLKKMFEK